MTTASARDCRDEPSYPIVEARRLVGVRASRVRRWVRISGDRHRGTVWYRLPVLGWRTPIRASFVSFLDLVDLVFARQFLEQGISLSDLCTALDEACAAMGAETGTRRNLFTDGSDIHVRVPVGDSGVSRPLPARGWDLAPVVERLSLEVDFDGAEKLARRWYPLGRGGHVAVDPFVRFGRPMLLGRGLETEHVYDLYRAEGESVEAVRSWWKLSVAEVEAAVRFERRYATA